MSPNALFDPPLLLKKLHVAKSICTLPPLFRSCGPQGAPQRGSQKSKTVSLGTSESRLHPAGFCLQEGIPSMYDLSVVLDSPLAKTFEVNTQLRRR